MSNKLPPGAYPGQGTGPAYPTAPPGGAVGPGAPPPYSLYGASAAPTGPPPSSFTGMPQATTHRGYAPYPSAVNPDGTPVGGPMAPPPMRPMNPQSQTYAAPYPQTAPAPGGYQTQYNAMPAQPAGPATAVFDAGARFGSGQVRVPPPPPGCMPNAAQMAAAQGQSVQAVHQKGDFWSGSGGGGYTMGL